MKLTKATAKRIVIDLANRTAQSETAGNLTPHVELIGEWAAKAERTERITFGRLLCRAATQNGNGTNTYYIARKLWYQSFRRTLPMPDSAKIAAAALSLNDWWSLLGAAGALYGVAITRPGTPTVQGAASEPGATPIRGGLVSAFVARTLASAGLDANGNPIPPPAEPVVFAGSVPELAQSLADYANGWNAAQPSLYRNALADTKARATYDPSALVRAPALSRALKTDTREHEHVTEDGDHLRSDGASVLAAGLDQESALAYTVRKRTDKPAVLVLADWSSSMNGDGSLHCAKTVHALADACFRAGIPFEAHGFNDNTTELIPFGGRPVFCQVARNGTCVDLALSRLLPRLARRRERRRICLVVTDGEFGGHSTIADQASRYARANRIELYAIGLGVDVQDRCTPPEWRGKMRLDNPADLQHVAARELAKVIHR